MQLIIIDDIKAKIQSIIKYGGTIVQQVGDDAPEITARFTDPAGNVLRLFQEKQVS